jgi:predicted P-loop ATPase
MNIKIETSFKNGFPESMIYINNIIKYIWAGIGNEKHYLIDDNGNTIYLPIKIIKKLTYSRKKEDIEKYLIKYIINNL